MNIGVISDTHGSIRGWSKALEIMGACESIIHCGDFFNHGPGNPAPEQYNPGQLAENINGCSLSLFAVKGNCDSEVDQKFLDVPMAYPLLVCRIDNLNIYASHGHLFTREEWIADGKRWKADILINGHTHLWSLEKEEGIVLLNPGSPSLPRNNPSAATINTESRMVRIFNTETSQCLKEILF